MLIHQRNNTKKKPMDKNNLIPEKSDDLSVLRVLMHNIKGLSAVELTPAFSTADEEIEE